MLHLGVAHQLVHVLVGTVFATLVGLAILALGCTAVLALSQPDALLDANDALDGYTNPIGFTLLGADPNSPGGRRLDSTETAPDPAPALAAAQEAEARRAAQEEQRRKDVADKRAAFLARLSP